VSDDDRGDDSSVVYRYSAGTISSGAVLPIDKVRRVLMTNVR